MKFLCFMFLKNKRSEGGAVGVVLIQFSKRFRPVAENGNKEHHLRSPLEASSQLQKYVIVVVGCFLLLSFADKYLQTCPLFVCLFVCEASGQKIETLCQYRRSLRNITYA
jgi:hypothetical protein